MRWRSRACAVGAKQAGAARRLPPTEAHASWPPGNAGVRTRPAFGGAPVVVVDSERLDPQEDGDLAALVAALAEARQ